MQCSVLVALIFTELGIGTLSVNFQEPTLFSARTAHSAQVQAPGSGLVMPHSGRFRSSEEAEAIPGFQARGTVAQVLSDTGYASFRGLQKFRRSYSRIPGTWRRGGTGPQ